MAGMFDFLDTLGQGVTDVAGRAVDAASDIYIARQNAENAARVADQQNVAPASALSSEYFGGLSQQTILIAVAVVLVGALLLMKRRR